MLLVDVATGLFEDGSSRLVDSTNFGKPSWTEMNMNNETGIPTNVNMVDKNVQKILIIDKI